jgi:hypothetical protein
MGPIKDMGGRWLFDGVAFDRDMQKIVKAEQKKAK